jgi:hypothetical protein
VANTRVAGQARPTRSTPAAPSQGHRRKQLLAPPRVRYTGVSALGWRALAPNRSALAQQQRATWATDLSWRALVMDSRDVAWSVAPHPSSSPPGYPTRPMRRRAALQPRAARLHSSHNLRAASVETAPRASLRPDRRQCGLGSQSGQRSLRSPRYALAPSTTMPKRATSQKRRKALAEADRARKWHPHLQHRRPSPACRQQCVPKVSLRCIETAGSRPLIRMPLAPT